MKEKAGEKRRADRALNDPIYVSRSKPLQYRCKQEPNSRAVRAVRGSVAANQTKSNQSDSSATLRLIEV